jgi:hypothetical protein
VVRDLTRGHEVSGKTGVEAPAIGAWIIGRSMAKSSRRRAALLMQ